ncbi:MAG TPA: hypothetical protein VI643_03370 [Planctomycetota bacterium]|nr:hypothetical protein [Planctomycetota bacterium]
MAILDIFRNKKITSQDIRLEKIRLERREQKMAGELEKLSKEKEELFRKGAETSSRSLRMIYARKFEEVTKRVQMMEVESNRLWKQVRLITALEFAYERSGRGTEGSLLARLGDRQVTEILKLVDADDVRGQVFMDRLDEILGTVDAALGKEEPIGAEGKEILRVWEKMDEGSLEFEEGLKKASEEAGKKQKEPN